MKTALITGVSGYLGSHVAKELKKAGWKVVGLDIVHTINPYVDIFYLCNVRDDVSLNELFSRVKIDTVFHFAGLIEVGESVKKPSEYWRVNAGGTINLLDVMKRHKVNNILYSSTAGLYETNNILLNEECPVNPYNNPYAGSKYAAEIAIKQSGLNYQIFRYFNLAGADPEGEFGENHFPETHLIPRIFENLNNFTIYGKDYDTLDGTCVRDYVHVSDVAEAHVLAANNLNNLTINRGTGEGYSVKEIVNLVEFVTGNRVNFTFGERREGDPSQLVADISLAKEHLNYLPKHSIVSIVDTAYKWHSQNEERKNRV
jgi:UDP-glucose-4-epimerase GalE